MGYKFYESLRYKVLRRHWKARDKLIRAALSQDPNATLENVLALRPLDGKKFTANIAICFPVFIQLVSEGRSISEIARLFQMKRQPLRNILTRNEPLHDEYLKAKKLASDRRAQMKIKKH